MYCTNQMFGCRFRITQCYLLESTEKKDPHQKWWNNVKGKPRSHDNNHITRSERKSKKSQLNLIIMSKKSPIYTNNYLKHSPTFTNCGEIYFYTKGKKKDKRTIMYFRLRYATLCWATYQLKLYSTWMTENFIDS